MPDVRPSVKEVFDMVAKQVEPDVHEWNEQERRQRRRNGAHKAGAMALVAAVVATLIVGLVRVGGRSEQPAVRTPSPVTPSVGSLSLVAIDVANGSTTGTPFGDIAAGQADVSPNGRQIAFIRSARNGHTQIYIANIDGTNQRRVTGLPDQQGCSCGARDPDWSPDGTQVAFSGLDLDGNKDIYVLDLGLGSIKRITRSFSGEAGPDWSPDGRTIAYESGDFAATGEGSPTTGAIWTFDFPSGQRTRLVRKTDATSPTWSPDGTEIAFAASTRADDGDLWTVAADGTGVRKLLALSGTQTAPAWSPARDVPSIAFGSDQGVSVLNVDSGQVRAVAAVGGDPAWSADGSTVYAWRSATA
jgi:Tol biopolymer transport system component